MLLSSVNRRAFCSNLLLGIPALAVAQKAILENGKAVVCSSDSIKCPNGHPTCTVINAPIVVGNDNKEYPEASQLFDYHVLRCNVCHILFTKE